MSCRRLCPSCDGCSLATVTDSWGQTGKGATVVAFGSKGRIEELEKENANLKQWVEYLKGTEAIQLAQQVQEYRSQISAAEQQVLQARAQLAATQNQLGEVRAKIVVTEEQALLQEVGIYEYRHPLDDAVAYKSKLADTKNTLKTMVRNNQAVSAATGWTVNNSAQQGTKLVRDISKLMLRAYNAEADNLVRTLRPHSLSSAIARLAKARETIARLGSTMDICVTDRYHE
jgi:phage shock protein A